jgi:hypothetical protein
MRDCPVKARTSVAAHDHALCLLLRNGMWRVYAAMALRAQPFYLDKSINCGVFVFDLFGCGYGVDSLGGSTDAT